MLTTILCDMGNVLIRYEPETFLDRCGIVNPQDRSLLLQEIYYSPLWREMDLGQLDELEMEELVLPHLPEKLHPAVHRLIFHWEEQLLPVPGITTLLERCKAAGLQLYLVSNASRRHPSYWPRVPGNTLFDGLLVSAFHRCGKPSPEFFRLALEKFHLAPEKCLFVDDLAENVQGAKAVGIPSFQFSGDTEALRRQIEAGGVILPPNSMQGFSGSR